MSDWSSFIGRTHAQSDILTSALVQRHRATLDVNPADPAPLPGIHWCLNLPEAPTADLGEDGHPRRDLAGSFLPPIDLPRRMWAASEVQFLAPIPVGATVERVSTIRDIKEKSGSSGRLAFVTLDHATSADGIAVVQEMQTLVYREAVSPSTASPSPTPPAIGRGLAFTPDPADWPHTHTLTPSETLLFRFSALTFNTHRIHYDAPYAREVEAYAGLVVHGPLIATMLLNWAGELLGGPVRQFNFRASAPTFAGEPLTLAARREGDGLALSTFGPGGTPGVTASAS
jgi:3-methylfumaryl-CoA hydratase